MICFMLSMKSADLKFNVKKNKHFKIYKWQILSNFNLHNIQLFSINETIEYLLLLCAHIDIG